MNRRLVATSAGAYHVLAGGPLVFTAPHEQEHLRDGRVKQAESGTGDLAIRAATLSGGTALVTHGPQIGDPNWDDPHPFAEQAVALARGGALIDIHMMRPRGFDLCLGLGPDHDLSKRLWRPLLENLIEHGFTVCVNWPFPARGRPLAARAARAGIPGVQVEVSYELFTDTAKIDVLAASLANALSPN